MCGIAAIISANNKGEAEITSMLNQIKHRGDSLPVHANFQNSFLGIVRLRIVDIENGIQPFYNEDGSVIVVFNGEIYNYKKLRKELEYNHRFTTDCDTEIIPHLYEEYGTDFIAKLEGMFAFVLYDSKKNDFLAIRDFYGVKPLFYTKDYDTVYFASELKAFQFIDTQEYSELAPGHYMTSEGIRKYYSIPKCDYISSDEKTIAKRVRYLLEIAVKKRVNTELPIAVFMGGGIDSAIVNLLATKYHPNVTSIIIGLEDSEDVYYGLKLCEDFNLKHIYIPITEQEIINSIPEVIKSIETFEPNLVRGSVISNILAKHANLNKFKIVLCGEGSDEIFGGYGDFLSIKTDTEFQNLLLRYLNDLYRTQLQRIDRTGMRYSVEVREPFLDRELVEYVLNIPPSLKVSCLENGEIATKYILREAFKDLLPEYIYSRQKQTMMDGAGIGEVDKNKGLLYRNAETSVTDTEFYEYKELYPEYSLNSKEEVVNFKIYKQFYLKAIFNRKRVSNAQNEIYREKQYQFEEYV